MIIIVIIIIIIIKIIIIVILCVSPKKCFQNSSFCGARGPQNF